LELAAFGRDHELDEFLSYFRLKPFGVSFVYANYIGNNPAVFAIGVDKDLRLAGRRQ
jgi:hypothetical protein